MIGVSEPVGAHEIFAHHLGLLTRRLRSIDLGKLSQGDRILNSRILLQQMADAARSLENLPTLLVPELSPSALADQFETIGKDLLALGATDDVLEKLSEALKGLRLEI